MRAQNLDITHFEEDMEKCKAGFARNYDLASRKFTDNNPTMVAKFKELSKQRRDGIFLSCLLGYLVIVDYYLIRNHFDDR